MSRIVVICATLAFVVLVAIPAAATRSGTQVAKLALIANPSSGKPTQLIVMNADGSSRRVLARNGVEPHELAWSPDGRKIAFSRGSGIWVIAPDGSGERRLTRKEGEGLQWAPNGGAVAFVTYPGPALWTVDADGTSLRRLAGIVDFPSGPIWSTDGRKIAFASQPSRGEREIWVVDVGSRRRKKVWTSRNDFAEAEQGPEWSPDGRRLAFGNDRELVIIAADGTAARRQAAHAVKYWFWARSGRHVFAVVGRKLQLVRFAANGKTRRAMKPDYLHRIALSPDGRRIAYERRFGDGDVWVMDVDGSPQRRLTESQHSDYLPTTYPTATWSPDSSQVTFLRGDEEDAVGWPLWAVRANGGAPRRLAQGLVWYWRWQPMSG